MRGLIMFFFLWCFVLSYSVAEGDDVYTIYYDKIYEKSNLYIQDVASVEYVKLETTDNCLIDDERYLEFIRIVDDNIFISCRNNIYRFNRNGTFINKIGHMGSGPEEYISIQSIAIDEKKKEVLVCDMSKKILSYDYEGNFIRFINLDSNVSQFDVYAGGLICLTNDVAGNIPGFSLRSMDNGKIVKKMSGCYHSRSGISYYLSPRHNVVRRNGDNVYFNSYITDTIFCWKRDRLIPSYIALPANNSQTTENCETCVTPFLICETDVFANLHVYGKNPTGKVNSFIVDKRNKVLTKGYIYDNNTQRAIFLFNSGVKNQVVSFYYVHSLLENKQLKGELLELTKRLQEDDNPILMIATCK